MRFLIAFVAIIGYATAGLVSPLVLGANPGDVQAAVIDSNVAAIDHARAINENHARAAEATIQHNTEAVRQAAETGRDLHQNAYWNGVAASQSYVAAAQSQAAALDGAAAGVRAAYTAAPLGYAAAPLGYAAAPLAYAAAPLGYAAAPLGYAAGPLGYGLGAHGLGLRAW